MIRFKKYVMSFAIDKKMYDEAKQFAHGSGKSLAQFIREAVDYYLEYSKRNAKKEGR
jgi:predicted DNA-binding protein